MNTANQNLRRTHNYSSVPSSSTTALDFFAREDGALGFLAVAACFVDAGRYDTSVIKRQDIYNMQTFLFLLAGSSTSSSSSSSTSASSSSKSSPEASDSS